MRITIPTIGTGTQGDGYRPDLPEGIRGRDPEYGADYSTVTVTLPDTPEVEQWAVEQGYHTPTRVTSGRFQLALKARDAQVYAAVRQMIGADENLALAAGEPHFNRNANTIAGLQQQLQAAGFDQVTDEWIDALFREAFLLEL